jgi:hypothetical protein
LKKSDDDERHGGRTYIDPSDAVLHHATGRDPDPLELDDHRDQCDAGGDRPKERYGAPMPARIE